ncbi:adenine nucleotide alpha hydrolases-like protein [Penicillium chermesinum]|nr:adenine nucleotide alpha hydrolases-like protein [Penicillium chermesinum]
MATNPISTALFLSQFRRAWVLKRTLVPWDRDTSSQLPTRIGLAVSGGADSMAMAFLSREIERTAMAGEISVTALVVDHKAREESSLEARTVAGWLADLGISTKLLELDWSSFMQSADDPVGKEAHQWAPTAFETHARRLRYQAIGSACRDLGISTLLLGHHQDDLVETTLWRMARGARSTGLQGIKEMARIPECQGLFGISESGSSVKAYFKTDDLKNVESARSVLIADGGIFLCRPLLAFPKRHLLDTCHIHNIPYVNDPTNFDPTLTARNAIRHIRASHSLPLALQAPRITALCHTNGDSSKELLRLSNEFLASRCRILETHWDTGTMQIQVLDEKILRGQPRN